VEKRGFSTVTGEFRRETRLSAGGRWIRTSGSARDKRSVRRFHFAPELIATDGSPQMIDGGMLPKPPIFALSRRLHRTRNRKFESTSLQR